MNQKTKQSIALFDFSIKTFINIIYVAAILSGYLSLSVHTLLQGQSFNFTVLTLLFILVFIPFSKSNFEQESQIKRILKN